MLLVDCNTTKKLIEELDMKTTDVLCNMCKHNPRSAQPTYKDEKGGPHPQACALRFLTKQTCVQPFMYIKIYVYIYIYIYMIVYMYMI